MTSPGDLHLEAVLPEDMHLPQLTRADKSIAFYKQEIEKVGGTYRIIGAGGYNMFLNTAFRHSLLGLAASPLPIDLQTLTPYEKVLYENARSETPPTHPRIRCIIDIDGVLLDPLQDFANHIMGHDEISYYAHVRSLRWFAKVAQASKDIVLWSSRIKIPDSFSAKSDSFSLCPFINTNSVRFLNRKALGDGKVTSVDSSIKLRRVLEKDSTTMASLATDNQIDIIYYFGSGIRDRRAMLDLMKKHPELRDRVIFFDTGNLII